MTPDLREKLERVLSGRRCILGLGNPLWGDDAFGVRLAEELRTSGVTDVFPVGTEPERWIDRIVTGGYETVLLLDAVDFPGEPGSVVLMSGEEVVSAFPQVSTHKMALGTFSRLVTNISDAQVWCLGVKPDSLAHADNISEAVGRTKEALKLLLLDVLGTSVGKQQ